MGISQPCLITPNISPDLSLSKNKISQFWLFILTFPKLNSHFRYPSFSDRPALGLAQEAQKYVQSIPQTFIYHWNTKKTTNSNYLNYSNVLVSDVSIDPIFPVLHHVFFQLTWHWQSSSHLLEAFDARQDLRCHQLCQLRQPLGRERHVFGLAVLGGSYKKIEMANEKLSGIGND